MKRILSIITAGCLALVAFSCVKEENAVVDISKATAPVLLSASAEDNVTVMYTPAVFAMDFNKKMPVYHTLALVSINGEASNITLTTKNDGSTLTLTGKSLTNVLKLRGFEVDDQVPVEVVVRGSIQDPSRGITNGYIDSKEKYSFTWTMPDDAVAGNPWEEFTETSSWGLIGSIASTGNSWNADGPMYSTPDGTRHVARNVKFTTTDQFKVRKDGGWDVNFGAPGETEPYVMTIGEAIEATPGGKNLGVPVDGNYDLLLDEDAGSLTLFAAYVTYPGFDEISTWSVIGNIPSVPMGWDKDIQMTTDGEWHVAEGVVLTTADQFKFRKDCDWGTNFGAPGDTEPVVLQMDEEYEAVNGGKNYAVPADGTYDLLVNPDASLVKIVASLGGKSPLVGGDTPQPPAPAVTGWNIIGLNGDWENDILATQNGNVWTVYATATEATAFKWRKDGAWDENYGGVLVALGEPFAAEAGGSDIAVEPGFYEISLDTEALTITVKEGNVFSLIGEINGDSWSKDIYMSEKNGIWTSVTVSIEGGFKIRHNCSWADENVYGAEDGFTAEPGVAFTAVQPGGNIAVEPGNYKVTFNPETKEILIGESKYPEQLFMIGDDFGSWNWDSDGVVEMTPVVHNPDWGAEAEGQFWTVRYITAGRGFKFCSQRAWNGDFWGLTYNDGFTEAGGNCTVAEDGIYMVHVDFKNEKVHVEPARIYGIGSCFGGWTAEMEDALFKADGKVLKATTLGEGELRMYAASSIATSDWWTREFIFFEDGIIDYRGDDEGQGDQARFSVKQGQTITLDFNAGTGSVSGEGVTPDLPENMYMIGGAFGNWSWDDPGVVELTPVNGKKGQFWTIRSIEAGSPFKFCAVKAWSGDFTGLGEDSGYTVNGGNCEVAESGVYMIYVDTDNKKLVVEPAKVYGIGDTFGGWNEGMENALFAAADGKLSATVAADGELRMYAASSAATSDWWTREFIILDGQIAYRGNGGDQERVSVKAGQKVTLDFNAGTGVIE